MEYFDSSAQISGSVFGKDDRVYRNAVIKSSSFGDNCLVGDSCRVEDSVFGYFVWLYPNGMVYSSRIGDYSYAQKNSSIWHSSIGRFCSVSWNVSIGGGEHDFRKVTSHSILYASMYDFVDAPLYDRFSEDCIIGNDVWIGAGAHVLRGVSVGDGAVIAAGAVVTKNVEPYSIVAGVPAKKIGQRCSDELIERMLHVKWWDFPKEMIKKNIELFNNTITEETADRLEEIRSELTVVTNL